MRRVTLIQARNAVKQTPAKTVVKPTLSTLAKVMDELQALFLFVAVKRPTQKEYEVKRAVLFISNDYITLTDIEKMYVKGYEDCWLAECQRFDNYSATFEEDQKAA